MTTKQYGRGSGSEEKYKYMFENIRHEYSVRSCPVDEPDELEELLNEMSEDGWDLYTIHEAESLKGGFQYNCIFFRDIEEIESETDKVVDINGFKSRIEKMLTPSDEPSERCKDIQQRIATTQEEIHKIKSSLDSGSEDINHAELNEKISDTLYELNELKEELASVIDPDLMYERIGQEKLTIELSDELSCLVDNSYENNLIYETVNTRQKLTDKLGYVIPAVKFTSSDELEANEYRINVRDLKSITGFVYPGYLRFYPGQSNIETIPSDAIEDVEPLTGETVFWIEEPATKNFWEKGITPANVITNNLEYIACRHVNEILDYADINKYVGIIADKNMYLIDSLIPEFLTIGDVRYILAGLLRERISIKDLVYIFERLNDLAQYSLEKYEIIEKLRLSLSRQICNNISDENGIIYGIVISDDLSEDLEEYLNEEAESLFFLANEPVINKLIGLILDITKKNNYNVNNIAVIASPQIHLKLYYLLEQVIPGISVISKFELSNDVALEVIEEIHEI